MEIYNVIMRKDGKRMSITPAVLRAASENRATYLAKQRAKNLLGLGGKQIQSKYKCPFSMAYCNGRGSHACERCKALFENGEMPRPAEIAARAPCPFGIDSCKSNSTACADCYRAKYTLANAKRRGK